MIILEHPHSAGSIYLAALALLFFFFHIALSSVQSCRRAAASTQLIIIYRPVIAPSKSPRRKIIVACFHWRSPPRAGQASGGQTASQQKTGLRRQTVMASFSLADIRRLEITPIYGTWPLRRYLGACDTAEMQRHWL